MRTAPSISNTIGRWTFIDQKTNTPLGLMVFPRDLTKITAVVGEFGENTSFFLGSEELIQYVIDTARACREPGGIQVSTISHGTVVFRFCNNVDLGLVKPGYVEDVVISS